MNSLPRLTDTNFGGGKSIRLCPVHLVESINETSPATVTFASGGEWFTIAIVSDSLNSSIVPEDAGGEDINKASVECKYAGDTGGIARYFQMLRQYRYFILIVKDSNNNTQLVGTKECPMEFSYTKSLGGSAKGFRGYSLSFKGILQYTPPRILE